MLARVARSLDDFHIVYKLRYSDVKLCRMQRAVRRM